MIVYDLLRKVYVYVCMRSYSITQTKEITTIKSHTCNWYQKVFSLSSCIPFDRFYGLCTLKYDIKLVCRFCSATSQMQPKNGFLVQDLYSWSIPYEAALIDVRSLYWVFEQIVGLVGWAAKCIFAIHTGTSFRLLPEVSFFWTNCYNWEIKSRPNFGGWN